MNSIALFTMYPASVLKPLKRMLMQTLLNHYQRNADVELQKAKEAQANARYYERKAMLIKADLQ